MDCSGVDFGDWVGATDSIENLAERIIVITFRKQAISCGSISWPKVLKVWKKLSDVELFKNQPDGQTSWGGVGLLEAKVVTEPSSVNDQVVEWLMPIKAEHR